MTRKKRKVFGIQANMKSLTLTYCWLCCLFERTYNYLCDSVRKYFSPTEEHCRLFKVINLLYWVSKFCGKCIQVHRAINIKPDQDWF
ncbi:hypothetical protein M6B38_196165 [Iris pallida]|uniref:Uncharacterized protein n=1 Tax=Iris pallida TaxID=29817 RepID=A0AAX6ECX5_IRIPA|nr:hypothetical protein M6B38_196165 [Iris pallida]